MSARILIAHTSVDMAAQLEETLAELDCAIFRADNIEAACHLLHQHPDLLLLDMNLAIQTAPDQLASLGRILELSETACLRLLAKGQSFREATLLAPFACCSIAASAETEQIVEMVSLLLNGRQVEIERNMAQERHILHQMEVAEGLRSAAQIQRSLLPTRFYKTVEVDCCWHFIPCETVGGDLLNVMSLSEDTLMAYMLDVSGHGVPSAMVTVSVHQSLSDRTGQLVKHPQDHPPYFRIASPAEVLDALDAEYPYERFEKFFTITYLLLEPATGRLHYCNGGHPPPLLIHQDGSMRRLMTGGTLVGMGGLLPFEDEELHLLPGDRVYLYSDGITEHENDSGEMFGEERLIDFLQSQHNLSIDDVADRFVEELTQFAEGKPPADDISLLCIQFNGPKPPAAPSNGKE